MDLSTERRRIDEDVAWWRLVGRLFTIMIVTGGFLAPTIVIALLLRITRGRDRSRRFFARGVVRMLQVLGPTFVKFGQLAGTRRDALSAQMCDALSTLHDAVRPMSSRRRARALRDVYGAELYRMFYYVEEESTASGSIACVYRAVLSAGGDVVVLKLKRPGINKLMRADLELMRRMVRVAERFPRLGGAPMSDLVGYISDAILGQLDFDREADNTLRLRAGLAGLPGVLVPNVLTTLSRPDCLVLEYIQGLNRDLMPTLPADVRATAATRVLAAAHHMMFVDGFVHCDLHPGNVYVTRAGDAVILDAGYSVELPADVRRLIGEFFGCLATGNGRRCGQVVLESAVGELPKAAAEEFVQAIADLVARNSGPDVDFNMYTFGNTMFEIQRDHNLYGQSDFAFPVMSLLVLEGTVRSIAPEVDFRMVGELPTAPPPAAPPVGEHSAGLPAEDPIEDPVEVRSGPGGLTEEGRP